MNSELAADYLYLAELIKARLGEQLPGLPIEGVESMAQAVDAQDLRAAVAYVMYAGDRFTSTTEGTSVSAYQRWIVWLRVRHASTVQGDARNQAAGPLLSKLHQALAGWRPPQHQRSLRRVAGPPANYNQASALYPLAFETPLYL